MRTENFLIRQAKLRKAVLCTVYLYCLYYIEIGRLCAHVIHRGPHGAFDLPSPRKTTLLSDACHHGDVNAVQREYLQRQTVEPLSRMLGLLHRVDNKV